MTALQWVPSVSFFQELTCYKGTVVNHLRNWYLCDSLVKLVGERNGSTALKKKKSWKGDSLSENVACRNNLFGTFFYTIVHHVF